MNENEFMLKQQAAVERMREMNRRSQVTNSNPHKMPPVPSFVKVNNTEKKEINQTPLPDFATEKPKNKPPVKTGGFGIDFIDNLLKDGDSVLILGLILILMSENSDKLLLFALIYILL